MVCLTYVHKVLSGGVLTHLGCSDGYYMSRQMQMGEECMQKKWGRSCLWPWWAVISPEADTKDTKLCTVDRVFESHFVGGSTENSFELETVVGKLCSSRPSSSQRKCLCRSLQHILRLEG